MTTDHDPYHLTYRGSAAPDGTDSSAHGVSRGQVARTLLWTVLVISVVTNAVASFADAATEIHLACGVVTAVCVAFVVTNVVRRRR